MNRASQKLFAGIAAAMLLIVGPAAVTAQDDAVAAALTAVGGAEAIEALDGFVVEASGTRGTLDEGPVPGAGVGLEGEFASVTTVDLADDNLRIDYQIGATEVTAPRAFSEIVSGDVGIADGQFANFAPPGVAPLLSDRVASIRTHQELLDPILLLRDVAADPSIATAGEDAIEIAHGPTPITLWLDPDSGQVARATTNESTPLRRDVVLEVAYGDWTESAAGVSFPGAVTITYDGVVVHDETRTVDTDATIDASAFVIPVGLNLAVDSELATRGDVNHQHLQSFAAVGFPLDGRQTNVQAVELAPGLFHLTGGSWHSMAVIQDEGVVIIDAPLDETRSAAILGWLESVAPDLPVSHVVQSHHHVDHSGGLRSLAGTTGAQVVVGGPAASFYEEESFASPSEVVADGVDGGSIDVVAVTAEPLVIGADSANPVTVYPFPNPHAEDMVLVEAGGALWVVDIFTPGLGLGSPPPALVDFVTEQGIEVTQLVGGHGATDAWADVVGS